MGVNRNQGQEEHGRRSERCDSSDKTSRTGWQAQDGRGCTCGCYAACLARGRVDMGRGWSRHALARNREVRRWWRYILRQEWYSTFKRLPSNSDGRNTTSRALRRGRVGPRERPAVRGASRVRVVSIVDVVERYRQESTCCGGWVILKKCTAYFRLDVMGFFFFFSVTFLGSVGCRSQPPSVFY